MNPLESRKKLLIAESEINRAQLVQEWRTLTGDLHALAKPARTIGSVASATASLVAGLSLFLRKRPAPATGKKSWVQTILKGAQMVGTLWSNIGAPVGKERDK